MLRFNQYLAADTLCKQLANHSLDIPRGEMPQINPDEKFEKWLRNRGVTFEKTVEIPFVLKPTQNEFNVNKVASIASDSTQSEKPILISADNYCIDGHHRYIASMLMHRTLPILRINLPILDCLSLMNEYSLVEFKGIDESIYH